MSTPEEQLHQLRSDISSFSDSLKELKEQADDMAAKFEAPENVARQEGRSAAYRLALRALHIWTKGEFGVPTEPVDKEADAAVTA